MKSAISLMVVIFVAGDFPEAKAQAQPLGHPPNVIHSRDAPEDPRGREDRERRRAR